ncbi:MAG TPA: hypothetical protein VKV74_13160 [Bryobacteraceae bacterium]|nr:hypothetical protein [Bryobacteraceae bacterium]
MKFAGFLLLVCGAVICAAAVAILAPKAAMTGFLLAGIAVEILGLLLVFRSHLPSRESQEERE